MNETNISNTTLNFLFNPLLFLYFSLKNNPITKKITLTINNNKLIILNILLTKVFELHPITKNTKNVFKTIKLIQHNNVPFCFLFFIHFTTLHIYIINPYYLQVSIYSFTILIVKSKLSKLTSNHFTFILLLNQVYCLFA